MGFALENVVKTFPGGIVGVENIDLDVQDGELVTLVGPSGSGKTTTLRLIAGLELPTKGRVTIAGRDVTSCPPHQRRIGWVGQQPVLHPRWTVARHLEFAWALRHGPRLGTWPWFQEKAFGLARDPQFRRTRSSVAEAWHIEEFLDRRAGELSGGQQQQVALARATIGDPDVYLLDEPFSAVDARRRVALRWQFQQWQSRVGKPVLYVTHDQSDALALGNRVAVLRAGRIEQCGSAADVYDRPGSRAVAETVGAAPMNFLTGRLEHRDSAWWLVAAQGLLCLGNTNPCAKWSGAERDVTLAVRPEALFLTTVGSPSASSGQARGTIVGREPQGDSQWLRVELATAGQSPGATWLVQAPATGQWRIGEEIGVQWPGSALHAFEPETGRRWTEQDAA